MGSRRRAVGRLIGFVGVLIRVFFIVRAHSETIVGASENPRSTPGGGRTRAGPGLSRLPLPLGYGGRINCERATCDQAIPADHFG